MKLFPSWKRLVLDVILAVIILAIGCCVFEEKQSYEQAASEEGYEK